jgi:hypothetical protein
MKLVIPCTEDRLPQLSMLLQQLRRKKLLLPTDRVVVVNQVNRPFNLGMARNVGIAHKPGPSDEHVVVHDVDNLPTDQYPYAEYPRPMSGIREIVHIYGHKHSLNGVVCATYKTFCDVGGYISKDSWGAEDEILQKKCLVDRVRVNKNKMVLRFPDNNWFVEMDAVGVPLTNTVAGADFITAMKTKMVGYKKPPPIKGDLERVATDVTIERVDVDSTGVETIHVTIVPRKIPHAW